MEHFDTGMTTDHHYSANIKLELRKGSDAFIKMFSQVSCDADQKDTIFHFRTLLLSPDFQLPRGWNVPDISRCTLLSRQTGLDILNSDPKQPSPRPPPPPPALSVIRKCLSLPLYLRVSVCTDTCPAWPSFSLIPSVSVETGGGHLPHLAA